MYIKEFASPEELDIACAEFMLNELQRHQQPLFCPATGNSPTGAYRQLVNRKQELDTAALSILKLDEWAGLPMNHPGSCEYYLQQHLLQPLNIQPEQYITFDSQASDPATECERITQALAQQGPIDLCVLGLGLNGHLAFNDPADTLQPDVHLARLSPASLAHPMVQDAGVQLSHGYTLGIANIMQAKTILLMVNGKHKHDIFNQLMQRQVSTQLPASFLWLHSNAHCYYCKN